MAKKEVGDGGRGAAMRESSPGVGELVGCGVGTGVGVSMHEWQREGQFVCNALATVESPTQEDASNSEQRGSSTAPLHVGTDVGTGVGAGVGTGDGAGVGAGVGELVGAGVGTGVGIGVGAGVGYNVKSFALYVGLVMKSSYCNVSNDANT